MAQHTDIISKQLIRQLVQDMAHYILGLELTVIKELSTESQRIEQRRADIVMLVQSLDGEEFVLHLELQNRNDTQMPYRNLRYYSEMRLAGINEPIRQFVIYTGKPKLNMPDGIEDNGWNYRYTLIDMHQLDCERFIHQNTAEALVMAVLCDFQGRDEADILKELIRRLAQVSGEDQKGFRDHLKMMEHLSQNRGLTDKFKTVEVEMLREIELENLPSYQIGVEKGRQEGIDEGMEKGMDAERRQIAINCINEGMAVESIMKIIGLSEAEIQSLLESIKH
jgi:predicted transposase YdaD